MIKFFRKIRYDLMDSNKTGKYFRYAVGEIVLVVIGILIALQVNDWNENRKLRNTEIELLKELKTDLINTRDDLKSDIKLVQGTLRITDSLYKNMMVHKKKNSTEPFSIKTSQLLNPILYPKLAAYEALQNYGINNISNHNLRGDITDLYQLQLTRITEVERRIMDFDAEELKPYLRDISKVISDCENCYSITDFRESKANRHLLIQQPTDKLLQLYMARYGLFMWAEGLYDKTAMRIDNLIKAIDTELGMK